MQVSTPIPGWSTPPVPPVIHREERGSDPLAEGESLASAREIIYATPIAKTESVFRSSVRSFGVRSEAGIGSGAAEAAYAARPHSGRTYPEKSRITCLV
jgi:hypothetical protein